MKWMRSLLQGLLALVMLASGLAHAAPQGDYVLGAGDVIRVSVYQNTDLTMEVRISEGGAFSYPLLGTVKVGGLTVSAAEKKIADGLRDGNFLKQPQVSILVIQVKGNQVSVLGMVSKPGRYPLEQSNTKLSEMIAYAGGLVVGGSSDFVVVMGSRGGKAFRKEIDFPTIFIADTKVDDMVLENGDIIFVDRSPVIYFYGEVQRPGAMRLERDMTMMQALASAGGITLRGTEKGIRVNRRDANGVVQVLNIGMQDKLQKDDVIYVRESLF
jgi:polysaccharide export outer membrane protein